MARVGSKEIVIVASLLAAAGYVAVQRVRSDAQGAGRLGDGRAVLAALDEPLVRHALWEAPVELAPALEAAGGESRPALSPDGRFLVFASGARGSDANLFVCTLAGGLPGAARPLAALDTSADELAPAFSGEYLYFASDRPGGAGGLDLYRARFENGRAGEPERLDEALQSPADDTDPAPTRDDGTLVFARVDGRRSALFEGHPGSSETAPRLELPGAPADAREPALSADGRVLWFRAAQGTSSALWRALWLRESWQPARCVDELDSPADEGGPCLAANGFELTFTRAQAGAAPHLWHARSREVYVLPGRPWTWMDSAVVASLLALALMALLARRWPALELIYKCLLISVLLHLLLLFLMQYLFLGGNEMPAHGSDTHRVRFVPSARAQPVAERGPAAEHVELASLASPALPGALEALVRTPASEPASAPERGTLEREAVEAPSPSVALAEPREELRTRTGQAPALPLEARTAASEAARAALAPSQTASSSLEGPALALPAAHEETAPGRSADRAAPSAPASAAHVALAAPREGAQNTRKGSAPALAIEADAPRGADAPAHPELASGGTSSSALEGVALQAPGSEAPSAPTRADVRAAASNATPRAEVALAAPSVERPQHDAAPAPGLGLQSAAPASPSGPERPSLSSASATAREGASEPGPWHFGSPAHEESPAAPARTAAAPAAPIASAPLPSVALAQPSGEHAPARAQSAPEFELGSAASPRTALEGPARPEVAPAHADTPQPVLDSLVKLPDTPRADPGAERKSWDHTPYENRAPEQKARALQLHGGDAHTEEAVARGLDYLARIQQRGGNWGRLEGFDEKYGQVAVGKTGLALLAFLGAGHTQVSDTKHSAVVARAVDALLALQDPSSGHFGTSDAYSHGIATYALAEDLAMTGDARVRAALEPALKHILSEQNTSSDPRLFGGWSYYFPDGHVFDRWPRTAISAWQVMALESARLSGLRVPDAAFEGARRFLENARDEAAGNWRYNHDPQRLRSDFATLPASTPAAMFALSLLGDDLASADYERARAYVLERAPDGYRYSGDDDFVLRGAGNLYFWYYGTLALFRAGGADWKRWNEAMKRTLLPAQGRDGSWEPIEPYARYAKDSASDKSYTSAMCVLSLEVYYRYYLPLLRVR
ncbi:MAG: PD40 domain-containing protein [Planctomycetes bacterium]|nr:PD40 domain-containing protein [Planctomycetota bacterium]